MIALCARAPVNFTKLMQKSSWLAVTVKLVSKAKLKCFLHYSLGCRIVSEMNNFYKRILKMFSD